MFEFDYETRKIVTRMRAFFVSITVAAFSSVSYASEYRFETVASDNRGSFARFFESFVTVVTAYHVQATPHEAVHAGVAYSFGTKTKYWTIKPLLQSASYAQDEFERSNEDIFFTSMSAPVFSRMTANLPRWIHVPSGPGYWSRWSSGYWLMSTTSIWVTMVGAWASFAKDDSEAGWDFSNASRAISDSKSGQAEFLSGLTMAISADLFLNWEDYRNNFAAFGGSKAVIGHEKQVSFNLFPAGVGVTYLF